MMKRLFNYVLTGTLFLSAMACQQEQLDPNGGIGNTDASEVTTQFVLNVSAAPSTKMTSDAVQQNNNFRGIEHAMLYTFKTGITEGNPHILSTTTPADKEYDFGSFFASGALDPAHNVDGNTGEGKPGSKRVLQLSIPVNTDAILFYGKATKPSTGKAADAAYGATITKVLNKTPADANFAAKKILEDAATANSYDATASLMIWIINEIKDRHLNVDTESYAAQGWTLDEVTWAQYGHQYEWDTYGTEGRYAENKGLGHKVEGLEEILGKCYYLFTYIRPISSPERPHGEYRGGSSAAIRSMIIDMYKVITNANNADPTTAYEANAKRMATAILNRAKDFFNTSDGTYQNYGDIKSMLIEEGKFSETSWNSNFGGASTNLNGYPFEDFGIPEGAAQLGFVAEGKTRPDGHPSAGTVAPADEFFYYHPNKPLVNYTMTDFEPRKYVYPAELFYYVNSPLRTTGNEVTVASYPDGVTPWNTESSWTGWDFPGKVEGSTRGVAAAHSINYGVALLKSSVAIQGGVTYFEDNRSTITNGLEPNRQIAVSNASLTLRGILVGGVNPRMNWQFIRKYTSSGKHEGLGDLSKFDGVIYDHTLNDNSVPSNNPNYTLVYDNYNSDGEGGVANQNDVYVALEFVNGGSAFFGRDNLIPSGATFYLVAKLDKPTAEKAAALTWPTDHHIAPLYGIDRESVPDGKKAGDSKEIARIFIQDFVTTVTFKLNQTSLQKAYYSTPDLRASQMSLGLDVDLQWVPGLTYNDVVL